MHLAEMLAVGDRHHCIEAVGLVSALVTSLIGRIDERPADTTDSSPGAAMFRIACWYASLASSTRSAIRHDLRGQCERVRVEPLQVPHDLLAGVDDIRAGTLLGIRLRPLMAEQRT